MSRRRFGAVALGTGSAFEMAGPAVPLIFKHLGCCLLIAATQAAAQSSKDDPLPGQGREEIEALTVQASRLAFGVDGYLEPEVTYDQSSLRALAVTSLAELLEELAPDLTSGRGRGSGTPVVLVNGQRISGFREIRTFPPEAIERVAIYPEEVALRYGYRADQKVINFVLKQRFKAVTARLRSGVASAGGAETGELDLGRLHLRQKARLNVTISASNHQALHDSDRAVQPEAIAKPFSSTGNLFADELDPTLSALAGERVSAVTLPDGTELPAFDDLLATANRPLRLPEDSFRTLLPRQRTLAFNSSYTAPLSDTLNTTLSLDYDRTDSHSELGLLKAAYLIPGTHPNSPFASDVELRRGFSRPLARRQETEALTLSATLNGSWKGWSYNWINQYESTERTVTTARRSKLDEFRAAIAASTADINPFAVAGITRLETDQDDTSNTRLSSELLLQGVLAETGRGPVYAAASFGWRTIDRDAASLSDRVSTGAKLERRIAMATASLDAPLIKDDAWGELALNGNLALSEYSDAGGLSRVGAGLTWRPNPSLRLTGSWTRENGAPTMEQLADPVSRQPNRRLFDFTSGQTVGAVLLTGGNPELSVDQRTVHSLAARLEPFDRHDLALTISVVDSRIDDPAQRFPNPSPDLERAFPERFLRTTTGTLFEFDTRPINLYEEHRQEVQWGLRYARVVRQQPRSGAQRELSTRELSKREQRLRPKGGRDPRRSGADARGGRLRVALNHSYVLKDELTIAPGLAGIDYVGINNGTRRRSGAEHEVSLRASYAYRGFAARLNATWLDQTRSLPGRTNQLAFDSLTRVNLDLSHAFQPRSAWVRRYPSLRFARIRVSVRNLFDEKPSVRDQWGMTPPGFSQDELDPRGRTILLEFRKLFR